MVIVFGLHVAVKVVSLLIVALLGLRTGVEYQDEQVIVGLVTVHEVAVFLITQLSLLFSQPSLSQQDFTHTPQTKRPLTVL
jgi:hypothetical protein